MCQTIFEKNSMIKNDEHFKSYSSSEREESTLVRCPSIKRSKSFTKAEETNIEIGKPNDSIGKPIVEFYEKKYTLKNNNSFRHADETKGGQLSGTSGGIKSTVSLNKLTVDFALSQAKSPQSFD